MTVTDAVLALIEAGTVTRISFDMADECPTTVVFTKGENDWTVTSHYSREQS